MGSNRSPKWLDDLVQIFISSIETWTAGFGLFSSSYVFIIICYPLLYSLGYSVAFLNFVPYPLFLKVYMNGIHAYMIKPLKFQGVQITLFSTIAATLLITPFYHFQLLLK